MHNQLVSHVTSFAPRRLLPIAPSVDEQPHPLQLERHLPLREGAYTCWNVASGARANNYGTRIDLILMAAPNGHEGTGLVRQHVEDCVRASS